MSKDWVVYDSIMRAHGFHSFDITRLFSVAFKNRK